MHGFLRLRYEVVQIFDLLAVCRLQLCLPAPDILRSSQVRSAQPEQLIVEREHLSIFGCSI